VVERERKIEVWLGMVTTKDESVRVFKDLGWTLWKNHWRVMWRDYRHLVIIQLATPVFVLLMVWFICSSGFPHEDPFFRGLLLAQVFGIVHILSGKFVYLSGKRGYTISRYIPSDQYLILGLLDLRTKFLHNVKNYAKGGLGAVVFVFVFSCILYVYFDVPALRAFFFVPIWASLNLLLFSAIIYLDTLKRSGKIREVQAPLLELCLLVLLGFFMAFPLFYFLVWPVSSGLFLAVMLVLLLLLDVALAWLWSRDVMPVSDDPELWSGSFNQEGFLYRIHVQNPLFSSAELERSLTSELPGKPSCWKTGPFNPARYLMRERETGWGAVREMFAISLKRRLAPQMIFYLGIVLTVLILALIFPWAALTTVALVVALFFILGFPVLYFDVLRTHPAFGGMLDIFSTEAPSRHENFFLLPLSGREVVKNLYLLHLRFFTLFSTGFLLSLLLSFSSGPRDPLTELEYWFRAFASPLGLALILTALVLSVSFSAFFLWFHLRNGMVVGLPISPLNVLIPLFGLFFFIFLLTTSFGFCMIEESPFVLGLEEDLCCFFNPVPLTPIFLLLGLATYKHAHHLYETLSISR